MPRSGKTLRLSTYKPALQIRTIYDHILSVAHSADVLLPVLSCGVSQEQYVEVVRCIVYHDVAEVFLGDKPAFTNLSRSKRERAHLVLERQIAQFPPGDPEQIVNNFIRLFLDQRERRSFDAVLSLLAELKSPVSRVFTVLDKIDPIVAVWRYLHTYRGRLDEDASGFLGRMKDFFENPDVKLLADDFVEDELVRELVYYLQNRRAAQEYYKNGRFRQTLSARLKPSLLKSLIEDHPLTQFVRHSKTR